MCFTEIYCFKVAYLDLGVFRYFSRNKKAFYISFNVYYFVIPTIHNFVKTVYFLKELPNVYNFVKAAYFLKEL